MRGKLHHWILLGMIVGAVAGLIAHTLLPPGADGAQDARLAWATKTLIEPVGQVFLRLIFMVALPLVFCALALGVAEMGDVRKLGWVGARTLLMTVVLSTTSVVLGITLVKLIRPGEGLPEEKRAALLSRYTNQAESAVATARGLKSVPQTLLDIIPKNPLQEMVGAMDGSSPGGGMLSVMFFALMFGVALIFIGERGKPVLAVLQGVFDAVMVIIAFAMRLAPIGVAALLFSLTATLGFDIVRTLGWYVLTVLGALATQQFVIYSIVLLLVARMRPWRFFSRIAEVMMTALATSSSNATLPTALRVSEENLGLHPRISRFVLTIGAAANQNGTALFEGITVLFLAQVFGVRLDLGQQVIVVLMSILAGVGTAGIPSGSLPLIVIVLQSVGVPGEGIGIILGVDRLLDMCRTVVNVSGDITIAACVNRQEYPDASPPRSAAD